jgi:aldehyde:ferredoxin oxidoreductase
MKDTYLYAGKILWVDLTRGKFWTTPTVFYAERFLGGRGIGARIVWEKAGLPSVDPLGSENVLSFNSGPLTGTMMPGSGRCHVSSKSPLTGLLGMASFGGSFAPELKYAGYDHLVITGGSPEPVYLAINNDEVTIRSAANIWGLDTYETPKVLYKELNDEEIQWACIGPAGEKLTRFATIIGSTRDSAGRTGLGAVMGSKKLKAVAVRGTGGLRIANPGRFYEVCARTLDSLKGSTPNRTVSIHSLGEKGRRMTNCLSCPTPCEEEYYNAGISNGMIYYKWFAEMANKIGLRDIVIWRELALHINKNGYDAGSLGDLVVWATELFEQGIISEKDVGFLLARGNGGAYLKLAEMIARREGFGDVLAEGLMRATRAIGRGSERYTFRTYASNNEKVPHRLTEFYGHFAEGVAGTRIAFPKEDEGKAETVANIEDAIGRAEIVGSCKWHTEFNGMPITADILAEVLSTGLGKRLNTHEFSTYQNRVRQLERAFNCREGLRREYETLPDQYITDLMMDVHFEGMAKERSRLEAIKDRFYKLRGWDLTTGVPTRNTLESLDLKDVADELDKVKGTEIEGR